MRRKNAFSTALAPIVAALSSMFIWSIGSTRAQQSISTHADKYSFVVGSGFLCEPAELGGCPAVAKSLNGDTYEIAGAGAFNLEKKSVQAAGTFNHKSTNGSLLETGVWVASDLVSFDSYGLAQVPLRQRGLSLGQAQAGPKRTPLPSGLWPTGGLGRFRILLLPTTGSPKTAVLQLNSTLGDVPHEQSVEGIRLVFEGNNKEFSEEAGGHVMFLSQPHSLRR